MYKCKHFAIQELVSKKTYHDRGNKSWYLFDDRILRTADLLRERYGQITINDWMWGGKNQSRGLRTPESMYYSLYSAHSHGRAIDCIFKDVTAEQVRQDILNSPDDKEFIYINSFEE
jgi:hypothetical protein